jgi:hypothetical protein
MGTAVMALEMSLMALENQLKRRGKDVLYMLKNFHFNSGDARYVHSVNRDPYLAGGVPRWGRR